MSGQVALYLPLKDSLPWSDEQNAKTWCPDYQQDDSFLSPTVFIGSGFTSGTSIDIENKFDKFARG